MFEMQFHLIVVLLFLETCVKDHGDRSSRLLEGFDYYQKLQAYIYYYINVIVTLIITNFHLLSNTSVVVILPDLC